MPIYRYTAKDANGSNVSGTMEAVSEVEASAVLHNKSLFIISVEEDKTKKLKVYREKGIKLDDLTVYSRQLATMIDSGIPLVQALGILVEQIENKSLSVVTSRMRQDILEGLSFCDALSRHPSVFSGLFINMVKAGEASGMLDEILERLAVYLEKTSSLQRKIRSSLVYPAVIITMTILITTILLVKVVPTFKGIFELLGGTLPLPTRVLIAVSDIVRRFFLLCVGILFALGFLFRRYIGTPRGRYNFDARLLKLPVFGQLFCKVAVVKFCRTLATLVKSGVPILNSLEIVAKTAGNKVIEEAVENSRKAIREGEPIAQPLSKSKVFPPMVVRMIDIGEQTGKLEQMLTKIADFYDEQVDAMVSGMTSLIEPLVIAFLGVVIGGIVIALFLPIFKITQLIAK